MLGFGFHMANARLCCCSVIAVQAIQTRPAGASRDLWLSCPVATNGNRRHLTIWLSSYGPLGIRDGMQDRRYDRPRVDCTSLPGSCRCDPCPQVSPLSTIPAATTAQKWEDPAGLTRNCGPASGRSFSVLILRLEVESTDS
ncbi:hypothetical protein BKA81DRAFT_143247 [Phyllosticta paracitricarpa]